jgi:hypothetical protein
MPDKEMIEEKIGEAIGLEKAAKYYKMENDLSVCLILPPTQVSFVILVTDFIIKIANLRQLNTEGPSAS